MNGPQNMTSYGMTIQGLLGKDLLSLSMPEFKDDLKSSISVKNLKDLGNTQGSDPTSAYLGGYQSAIFKCSIYLSTFRSKAIESISIRPKALGQHNQPTLRP